MLNDKQIGWLAGVIDGEGTISIARSQDGRLHPQIFVSNSDLVLLEKVQTLTKELGANPRLHNNDNRFETGKVLATKPGYRVFIGTSEGMRNVLDAVLPELTTKKLQGFLMREYLEGRGRSARKKITIRDREIADLISALNRGVSGALTTARETLEKGMIQSALHGDMQRAAEMTAPLVN